MGSPDSDSQLDTNMKSIHFEHMSRTIVILVAAAAVVIAGACLYILMSDGNGSGHHDEDDPVDPDVRDMDLMMAVDGKAVEVQWEDNPSVAAIKKLARDGLTVAMERYGGFEQTGSMPSSVVKDDSWIEVGIGDIVLYRGVQICLYFDDNAYDFTRLGKISGMSDSEIRAMLDKPSVTAVFTLQR